MKRPTLAEIEPRLHYIAEQIYQQEEKRIAEEQKIAELIYASLSEVFNHRHVESQVCDGCIHQCPLSLQLKKIQNNNCSTKFVW